MGKSERLLMGTSIIIILLAILGFVDIGAELFIGENGFNSIEGIDDITAKIAGSFVMIVSLIFLIPELYVGFKGIKVAKNPDSSKLHIFLAIVIFIVTLTNFVSPILAIIKQENIADNGIYIIDMIFRTVVYFIYIKSAKEVAA